MKLAHLAPLLVASSSYFMMSCGSDSKETELHATSLTGSMSDEFFKLTLGKWEGIGTILNADSNRRTENIPCQVEMSLEVGNYQERNLRVKVKAGRHWPYQTVDALVPETLIRDKIWTGGFYLSNLPLKREHVETARRILPDVDSSKIKNYCFSKTPVESGEFTSLESSYVSASDAVGCYFRKSNEQKYEQQAVKTIECKNLKRVATIAE